MRPGQSIPPLLRLWPQLRTVCTLLCRAAQVAERAAEEKKREQAGLQKERLLLEKKAKKRQADADRKASLHVRPHGGGWGTGRQGGAPG